MLISYSWLREFVACDLPPAQLAERLTRAGLAAAGWGARDGDVVFDLEVTTNRPDCLGHYGVAREVAAILDRPLAPFPDAAAAPAPPAGAPRITIEALEGCARYCARLLTGLAVGPSRAAIAGRLALLGQRAINNIADLTNYVLFETGQPTHAFDADLLRGGEIRVRFARAGEKLLCLDGVERALEPADLVIADAERPVALAGIIGGQETAIGERTRRVVLESAWFEPAIVRRAAKRHGLRTEASYRFERGADPALAPLAAALIAARLGVASAAVDQYPRPIVRPVVALRPEALALLGGSLGYDEAAAILARLGFRSAAGTPAGGAHFQVPSWRGDVAEEVDLVEEVARVAGYDRFPPRLPAFAGGATRCPETELERQLRARLRGHGYAETVALSFAVPAACREFAPASEPIAVRNPLSEEASILRTSALPAMLDHLQYNLHRDRAAVRLYEIGKTYAWHAGQPAEARVVALGAAGAGYDFFDLKGIAEEALAVFAVAPELRPLRDDPAFHPGRSAEYVAAGRRLGRCGQMHPELAMRWKFKSEIYLAELDLEALLAAGPRPVQFVPPSRFPGAERDFSFLFPEATAWAEIRAAMINLRLAALVSFAPAAEPYRGASVPEGRYGLLLRARFQLADRTLRDDEIEAQARAVALALESLGAIPR